MKRFLVLLIFIFGVAACGNDSNKGKGEDLSLPTGDYVGEITGLTAQGKCVFEDNRNITFIFFKQFAAV